MSKLREAAEKVEMRPGDKLGAITVGLHDDPGIVLLRRIVDSISIVNKMACWDHFAMFELRDYLCERAALSAPAEPQEAAEPVVIAGRYTAYPQRGTPNHCFNAQVFGPDGLSVATFDSTADPRHAYRYAMALADALNAPAPQPAGGEAQPAAHRKQAEERKPLTDEQVLPLMKQAGLASKKCDSKPVATIEKTQPKPAQKKGPQ